MKKNFTSLLRIGLPSLLLAAVPFCSSGQRISGRDINNYLKKRDDGKNVSLFHRFELSDGLTYGAGSITINDRFRDQSNFNVITGRSRATNFNYRSMTAYGGVYFPLSYLSSNSILALNTGLYATGSVWQLGNTSLEDGKITSYEASDIFFGAAIGVDYIYGGEATLNKADKVTLRAGAGLMPYFAVGELADGSQDYAKVGFKPYVKAELGFFAGVEWKLKGTAILGSRTIYNYSTGDYNLQDSDYYYAMNFKIRPTYTIGIAVFPFSFGWESDKW
jgi:hypothetical protein